jgi:hypothetical protein
MDPAAPEPAGPAAETAPERNTAAVRADLERALAEVDRLSQEARDHARTRSTAERQAADLASLRKFHEKALAQVERLTMEKGVLAAEKGTLEKQLADAMAAKRAAEQERADAEKALGEARKVAAEKAALEKKLAELQAQKPAAPAPPPLASAALFTAPTTALPATAEFVPDRIAEPPPSGGLLDVPDALLDEALATIASAPPPGGESPPLACPHPLAETKEMPVIPVPPASAGTGKIDKIRYLCAGCGRKLGAPPEFAMTFGTCRFCGHRQQVPASSTR